MKKNILLSLVFLIPLASMAQRPQTLAITSIPQPNVTILRTEPEQPIEGMSLTVYFRFYNPAETSLSGWIGADINSGTGMSGKSQIDWPVQELGNKQVIDGAIMVNATDAGVGKKLRVFFYETQEIHPGSAIVKSTPKYQVAEKEINIAALINFRLNNFTINHTRARSTDSDFGSLYAVVNDNPVMQPASVFMGNFQDGTYSFGGINADKKKLINLDTGPIALVPGINSSLYIAYTIYNGGGVAERDNFLRGYAEATANPVMFHGPRPGTSTAIEVLKKIFLPLSIIGACDGLVVMDTLTIQSNNIFTNTSALQGYTEFTKRYNSEAYASQAGCGNTSDYTVNSNIIRLSKPGNDNYSTPRVFININAEKKINLEGVSFPIMWQSMETIDKDGNLEQVNDPAYGFISNNQFNAPHQVDKQLLVILRGSLLTSQVTDDNSLNNLNKGPLKQVTAIVQLVPGLTTGDRSYVPTNTTTVIVPAVTEVKIPVVTGTTTEVITPGRTRGGSEVIIPASTVVTRPPVNEVPKPTTTVINRPITTTVVNRPVTNVVNKPDTSRHNIIQRSTIIH